MVHKAKKLVFYIVKLEALAGKEYIMKKKIAFKFLSAIIAFALLIGVCAPTANVFASYESAEVQTGEKEKFNYVSLGASNVNGYGMYGYVDEWAYDYPLEKANQNVYGYKSDTPDSYPVLIADKLSEKYDVTLSQLAISSMRAEEIRFLLYDDAVADKYTKWRFYNEDVANVDYSDNWFVSAGWREMGYTGVGTAPSHAEALAALRQEYQQTLAAADLITVDVGMNNFGVYLQKEIKSPGHFGSDIGNLDPEVAAKYAEGKAYVIDIIEEELGGSEIPVEFREFVYSTADAMSYALVGYCLAFDDIMAWIYENNPDANVVVVSVTNLMHGVDTSIPGTDVKLPLGDIFGAVINAANTYTAALSPYSTSYSYANVSEGGHIELFGDEVRDYNGDPATISKDIKDCFDVYDNSLFLKTQVQKVFATKLEAAGVLQMHEIQKGMDETGLITYYNGFHYDYQSNMGPTGDYWHIKMFVGTPYEMYYKDFLNFMAYRSNRDLLLRDANLAEQKAEYFGEEFNKDEYIATIEATVEALEPVLSSMETYYAAYEQSLNIAYDVMTEIMREAAKIDEVNLAYLDVRAGDALLQVYFGTILNAIEEASGNPDYNFNIAEAYPNGFFETVAAMMGVPHDAVETFMYFEFAGMIGNSFFAHPNTNGQKEIYDAVWEAYTNDVQGLDIVIENIVEISEELGAILADNYDIVYEIVYSELKEDGVIDELKGNLEGAYADLIAEAEKYESADENSIYRDARIALAAELRATADTISKIIAIVDQPTIGNHTRVLLEELCASMLQHGYHMINLANALNDAVEQSADMLIEDLIAATDRVIESLKAEAEAKIRELEAELAEAAEEAKAAIQAEIERVNARFEAQIAAINARLEAQIAEIRSELEATIADADFAIEIAISLIGTTREIVVSLDDAVVDYFRTNLGPVYNEFATIIVEAVKYYIISGAAENFEEAAEAIKIVVLRAIAEAGEDVYAVVQAFVEEAVTVSYTPGDDSFMVSLNGGSAQYAQLLASLLMLGDDQVGFTSWDNIDYDMLAIADLVTIGYDEDELSGFAINQLLGYIANYVDGNVRVATNEYISGVFETLSSRLNIAQYEGVVLENINDTIDELLAYDLIGGREVQDMNWAELVGENYVTYIDQAREQIRAELIASGVSESYTITIDVVDYLYQNAAVLGISDALRFIEKNYVYQLLGDSAYYTIEIPVLESVVFAAESFLYSYVNFSVNYGKLIIDLSEINPDASVLLLGYYNAFDGLIFDLGDVSVNLGEAYQLVADFTSVQPFLYALYYSNVAYVDITNAQTVFDSYVEAGLVEDDFMTFLMLYLEDSSITDICPEGQEYVLEQILNALILSCVHEFDNACDTDCNRCGLIRDVADHVYTSPCDRTCNVCGNVRPVSGHVYSGCTDTICNLCGSVRPAGSHVFDGCTDSRCNNCSYIRPALNHVFDGCEDETCNNCSYVRLPGTHVYDNCGDTECNNCGCLRAEGEHTYTGCDDTDCDVCGSIREAGEHTYGGCQDTDCDNCGATRQPLEHVYSGCVDTDCNNCGFVREAGEHEYDGCTDTICNKCNSVRPSTKHEYDNDCDADCNNCGATRQPADHVYSGCTDTKCDVCEAKRTAGQHTLANCEATICDVCGETVKAAGHSFGDWVVEVESTKEAQGKKVRTCKNCDAKEEGTVPVLQNSNVGLTFLIVIGAIIVADVIAFSVYWFLIQKKTFADLRKGKKSTSND